MKLTCLLPSLNGFLIRLKYVSFVRIKNMNNLMIGESQAEVLEVIEGFLDASDMPGTHLNGFLMKKTCIICKDYIYKQLFRRG